jgi:hypothetical protein
MPALLRRQYYKTLYGRKLQIFAISYSVFRRKLFQPSLMFTGKAGAYPSEASFQVFHFKVGSGPCQCTLDLTEKACEGQTL